MWLVNLTILSYMMMYMFLVVEKEKSEYDRLNIISMEMFLAGCKQTKRCEVFVELRHTPFVLTD